MSFKSSSLDEIKKLLEDSENYYGREAHKLRKEAREIIARLVEEVELLREVFKDAKAAHDSLKRVYHGYPGKLEWPEIHNLRHILGEYEKAGFANE